MKYHGVKGSNTLNLLIWWISEQELRFGKYAADLALQRAPWLAFVKPKLPKAHRKRREKLFRFDDGTLDFQASQVPAKQFLIIRLSASGNTI